MSLEVYGPLDGPLEIDPASMIAAQCRPLRPSEATAEKEEINPNHYKEHPSGIECIQITEHMGFCLGNAIKYIWRAGLKDDKAQDLQKAIWYIQREIDRTR